MRFVSYSSRLMIVKRRLKKRIGGLGFLRKIEKKRKSARGLWNHAAP
jgi:hypothetical protein